MVSDGNNNWSKLDAHDKKAYWWAGAVFLGEHTDGTEWFVTEGDSDDQYFNFYLVGVDTDGGVTRYRSRHISKDTYSVEQAIGAIESLKADYRDIFAE